MIADILTKHTVAFDLYKLLYVQVIENKKNDMKINVTTFVIEATSPVYTLDNCKLGSDIGGGCGCENEIFFQYLEKRN